MADDDVDFYAPADDDGTEAVVRAPAPAPAPATDGFTPYVEPSEPTRAATTDGFTPYEEPKEDGFTPYTEPESAWGAFTRGAVHGVAPARAAAGTGMLTGAAIGAAVPIPGATLTGGLIGGFLGGMAGETVQDSAAKALGFDDDAVRAANVKEHPIAAAAGQAISNLAGFNPRGVAAASTRLLSAAISGAGETAAQVYQRGKELFTPEGITEAAPSIAAQTLAGAVAPNPYKGGTRLEQIGATAGARLRPQPSAPAPPAPAPAPAARPVEPPPAPVPRPPELSLEGGVTRTQPPVQAELPLTGGATRTAEPELPLTGGRTEPVQTEMFPPRTADQGEPHLAGTDQYTEHGSPGAEAAAGTAEVQAPPPRSEAHGPEDYGKTTPPNEPGGGMNVGEIDPTLAHAAAQSEMTARPTAVAGEQPPVAAARAPIPENLPGAQKPGGITAPEPPVQGAIRREPVEGGRGRSGRPIRTEELPIGTEREILERGVEKATGPKLPPEQAPPERQALGRQPHPDADVETVLGRVAAQPSWKDYVPRNLREAGELAHRFYEGTINALHPYARKAAWVEKTLGRPLEREEDFHRLARSIKGLGGKLESIYHEGPFDPETRKVIGPALNPILEKISRNPGEFTAYATARRAIEIEGQGKKSGVPLAEANRVVAKYGKEWGPTFTELQNFQNGVLKMGKHLIGSEGVAQMMAANRSYIPFYRAIDPKSELGDMFRTGGGLTVKDPIERLKGSERQILNPLESVLRNTAMITDLAEKNEVHRAMKRANDALPLDKQFMKLSKTGAPLTMSAEQRQRMLDAGIPPNMIEKMRFTDAKAFSPETGKMRMFENGKEQIYDVPKDIARVINGMNRPAAHIVLKILGKPASWLRPGATLTPEFGVKNVFRDQLTAFIQAKGLGGYVPFYDAIYSSLGRLFNPQMQKEFQTWLRNGGANANLVSFDRRLADIEPRSFYGKLANVVVHPTQWVDMLRSVSEAFENATRFGAYQRDIRNGVSAHQAAFNARELTVDFGRMGSSPVMRALNMLIPFFNANVQGLDRLGRAFRNDPVGTATKTLASITVPSMLLWMHNKDDPRYQELPQWQKMLFWIVMTDNWKNIDTPAAQKAAAGLGPAWKRTLPDGTQQYNAGSIWRLPKPFAEGQIFGSLPERIMESFVQQRPNAFKHVADSIMAPLSPSLVPQVVRPAIEQQANWNYFLNRPILPEGMTKKPQAQQVLPGTSETAKMLGQAIRAVAGEHVPGQLGSPAIIDNYIRQLTGGLGQHVVNTIDAIAKTAKGAPPTPERTWADIPGIKAFAVRFPDRNAQSIQDFYDTRKEQQEAKACGDKTAWTGDAFAKSLKNYRDAIQRFNDDKNMSPADKRTAIDTTILMMIETAKKGSGVFEKIQQNKQQKKGYAEGGEVESNGVDE